MAEGIGVLGGDELLYLPEPPQEPLPSDCCGTGCSPCVTDLYQEELAMWEQLRAMSVDERRRWVGEGAVKMRDLVTLPSALSPVEYRKFRLVSVKQMTKDSFLYSFGLPENQSLGLGVGQHAVLRYSHTLHMTKQILF